ncbi:hypothetical protein [Candidatus Mycoplasma haematohominis]|uniref:hypothetical protein n=1 Tax=Candidatus Mycoplasma haematohominis TaxID=1494318 RepID=UPI001C0A7303|nr:hypothetical protein [Candidatus Mycoplasma haemohominis]
MSTQAIAGAAAGAALLGGGGTLAAYAAGAFEKEPVNTYKTQVLADDTVKTKEYIGDSTEKIKKHLEGDKNPKYSDTLKGVWDDMADDAKKTMQKPSEEKDNLFSESNLTSKKGEISNFVNKWCEATSRETLQEKPSNETSPEGKKWKAFKDACFYKAST